MTTTPIGTLMKKIHRQSNAVTSRPPRVGPAIVATPATAPQMPNAAPRRSAGKTVVMIASVCGISSAAPTPCTARNAISRPGVGARPQAAGQREQRDADDEQLALAAQVAEPAGGDQQHGEHQRVGVDDPQDLVERGVQLRRSCSGSRC